MAFVCGNTDTPKAKLFVVPGFFNENIGQITKKVDKAVNEWGCTAMIVQRDDAIMAKKPHGIEQAVNDIAKARAVFENSSSNVSSLHLDVSLGGGLSLMADKEGKTLAVPRVWLSPVLDPGAYWDASSEALIKQKLLLPGDGDLTNRAYLDEIKDNLVRARSGFFNLGLIEESDPYELGLQSAAKNFFDKVQLNDLEIVNTFHAFLRRDVLLRIQRFLDQGVLEEAA